MARLVTILCPGGDTEEVDLDLNPVIARRIENGELSIAPTPKAAKAKPVKSEEEA